MKTKFKIRVFSVILFSMFCLLMDGCKKKSEDVSNNPPQDQTVKDVDGNVYHTVTIGTQLWMKENLAAVHYRNGDPVPNITGNALWLEAATGAYCNYNNDTARVPVYGRLYNWYAVTDPRKLCPVGWHIPSDEEWKQLEIFLVMTQIQADNAGYRGTSEGGKLKETGTAHWYAPNLGATNSSGFSALPGGYRLDGYGFMTESGIWWTATKTNAGEAIYRGLGNNESGISRSWYPGDEILGVSVRCVKD
jgi:uncharacterized protein (TIGR02145 family)